MANYSSLAWGGQREHAYSQNSRLVTSVAVDSLSTESMTALRTRGGKSGSVAILLSSGSVLIASAICDGE